MLLILFGIYAFVVARFQISRHYGLKGKGARIAGAVCFAFGIGYSAVLGASIFLAARALGLPDVGAATVSGVLQLAIFIAILVILVRIYGNAYSRTPPSNA